MQDRGHETGTPATRLPFLASAARVLFFCAGRETLVRLDGRHLLLGLVCAWLAGMGRYWDNPHAHLVQHLGVGSVVYVFVLSGLLWAVIAPFRVPDWSYRRVLTFVSLTSPPAFIYALPVERWYDLGTVQRTNLWFLVVVASWRVALWGCYLIRFTRLPKGTAIAAGLLPLAMIVAALTALNLQHAVVQTMAGNEMEADTPHDLAYLILELSTILLGLAFIPLLISYLYCVGRHAKRKAPDNPPARD